MKTLLFALAGIVIFSCKTKEVSKNESSVSAVADSAITEWKPPAPDSGNYRLVVNFYSIGSGSEYDLILAYEDTIGAYSGRIGKTLDYRKSPHGREGETDFCLKLNELSENQQVEFIKLTRETLRKGKYINIYENQPCLH